jgi:hypothetical protein
MRKAGLWTGFFISAFRSAHCAHPTAETLHDFPPTETFILIGHAYPFGRAAHHLRQCLARKFGGIVVL